MKDNKMKLGRLPIELGIFFGGVSMLLFSVEMLSLFELIITVNGSIFFMALCGVQKFILGDERRDGTSKVRKTREAN